METLGVVLAVLIISFVKMENLSFDHRNLIVVVNLLNPKTILFFVAFLPQFVDSTRGNPGIQFLFLGTIMISMGLVTDSIYAVIAGRASQWLGKTDSRLSYHQWFAGTVYLGLGIFTLLVSPARQS